MRKVLVALLAFSIACSAPEKKKRDMQGANRDFVQALLYAANRQDDKALEFFTRAVDKDTEFDNAKINRAIICAGRGRYQEALTSLDSVSDNATAFLIRGLVHIMMGNKNAGIENIKAAADRGNRRAAAVGPDFAMEKTKDLIAKEYEILCSDARKALEDIYTRAIKNGSDYTSHDMNDDAIAEFSKALLVKPESSEAFVGRGYAYIGKGMYDNAIADFRKAVKVNSLWGDVPVSEAHIGAGSALSKKSNFGDAILEYTMAIQKCPADDKETAALAHSNRGYARFNMKEFMDAISDFKKVLDLTTDEVRLKDTYAGLAISLYRNGEVDMAKEYYQKAIVIDKRYMWKFIELQTKEGLFYTEDELAAMKEILTEMGIKKQQ